VPDRVDLRRCRSIVTAEAMAASAVYCLAMISGLLRYRRPLPIYASLATLLASGLASPERTR
jgi:hypothetical protein